MRPRSDESIRRRDGRQEGDAAFCQITSDTFVIIFIIIFTLQWQTIFTEILKY